jgi:hypothetical protein
MKRWTTEKFLALDKEAVILHLDCTQTKSRESLNDL